MMSGIHSAISVIPRATPVIPVNFVIPAKAGIYEPSRLAHSSCGKHTVVFPSVENAVRLSASLLALRRDPARSASETVFRLTRMDLALPCRLATNLVSVGASDWAAESAAQRAAMPQATYLAEPVSTRSGDAKGGLPAPAAGASRARAGYRSGRTRRVRLQRAYGCYGIREGEPHAD